MPVLAILVLALTTEIVTLDFDVVCQTTVGVGGRVRLDGKPGTIQISDTEILCPVEHVSPITRILIRQPVPSTHQRRPVPHIASGLSPAASILQAGASRVDVILRRRHLTVPDVVLLLARAGELVRISGCNIQGGRNRRRLRACRW